MTFEPITIYRGDDYTLTQTWETDDATPVPIDLSVATWAAEIRRVRRGESLDANPVIAEFAVAFVTDGEDGGITYDLTAAQTALVPDECVMDVQATIIATGKVQTVCTRVVYGMGDVTDAE